MRKLKLMTIVGTRPEIIKMSAIIKKADKYFDQVLVHTGQNYDYTLNEVFFKDLGLREPDYYLGVVGDNLGQTMGNVISKSYELMRIFPKRLYVVSWMLPVTLTCAIVSMPVDIYLILALSLNTLML